ncbi:protein I'm not dead yet isoform X1 [Drosophila nasuta]|uniref:protein I'm not dead yet isoform X1 n=2 Tax=Drosophila nasuta TaxID=42062 RepID=UPI00295E74B0|nr:protein I'm not dead yet isoform X1 [Drosophila nasuta]
MATETSKMIYPDIKMEVEVADPVEPEVKCSSFFANHWKGLVVFLMPIICLPVMLNNEGLAYRCMYVLLIMAVFWVTEALPLYVTSMIPIIAFPTLGIMDSEATCMTYFKDTLVMFMGGIMVALAVEYSGLHKRLALRVIQMVGCSPRRLHFGLIMVTMFISMWISNAACTAMMCPIIQAVLEELQAQGVCKIYHEPEYQMVGGTNKKKNEDELPYPTKVTQCYYLGIAYASSLGGCGTIIGTATNLTFKGLYDVAFTNATEKLDFPTFMFYSVPSMLVYTLLTYVFLQWHFMGLWRPKSKEAQEVQVGNDNAHVAKKVIDQRYQELGPISMHEIQVMILFIIMVIMYFTRQPGIFKGWADYFNAKVIKNSMPTIFVVIMCFVLPANYAFVRYCLANGTPPKGPTPSLITWKFIQTRVPWGLIFLLGGGFALAAGSKASGMASLIGQSMSGLKVLPHSLLLLVVILVAVFMTAFSSNVAVANILIPVLNEMSLALKIHPLYLVFPAGLACSMAFHLPVSTPPNALVAGYAHIRSKDMAIAGIGPTIITIIVLFVFCQTWAFVVYPNLDTFPEWAQEAAAAAANLTAQLKANAANNTQIAANITQVAANVAQPFINSTVQTLANLAANATTI